MSQLDLFSTKTGTDRGFRSVRLRGSTKFERMLFAAMENFGFSVAPNGTEHTHPDFVSRLYQSTDQTSLAIRFRPDAIAQIGRLPHSFYVEAKSATTIEKTAYNQYQKLHQNGNVLVVVFGKLVWCWNFIENIALIDGQETVRRFSANRRFPVLDNWICPRECAWWHSIKSRNPQASGTPYREVDRQSLLPWDHFRQQIVERLREVTL